MRILKYLIFLFLIVAIGLSIYVAIQPDDYKIVKTRIINAPKPVIYEYVNNLENWNKWSVWFDHDPQMVIDYGATTEGKNASFKWNSNILGKGTITTTYISKDSIRQRLDFIKPKETIAHRFWSFVETTSQNGVLVTSGIEGKLSFTDKFIILFQNSMEHSFDVDFNNGLIKLDSVIRADMKKYTISTIGKTEYGGGYYLYQTTSARINETNIASEKMFQEIEAFMEQNYLHPSGDEFTLYQQTDTLNNSVIFSAGVPIKEKVITPVGSTILCGFIPSGSYFKTVMKGDYINMNEAWSKTREAIKNNNFEVDPQRDSFESYVVTEDETANPAALISEIYIPIKEKVEIYPDTIEN